MWHSLTITQEGEVVFLILQMGKQRLQEAAGASQGHITSWSERCIPCSRAPLLSGPLYPHLCLLSWI